MELVSCLNDAVELLVELASEEGVETFLLNPGARRESGVLSENDFGEDQGSISSLVMSPSSCESSRQLAFNKAWREARREMRGYVS